MLRLAPLLLIAGLTVTPPALAQEPPPATPLPKEVAARVEALIGSARERLGAPGLSAAVAVDGQVRWSGGSGLADVENEVPATEQTVYRLASITKPITAVAVLQLAEQGKLDLDAPIQQYVPRYPRKDGKVTPRLLLAHLGGVRHYKGGEMFNVKHYFGIQHGLDAFCNDDLACPPGTRFLYSTYGYNLLGAAVEHAAGIRYRRYIHDRICEPAGLDCLRIDDPGEIIPHRAAGYVRTPGGKLLNARIIDNSDRIPGAGLCGTAVDLARFAVAVQDGVLLKPETVERMLTPQATRDGEPVRYGLGWNLTRHEGRREAWHGGALPSVSTILYTRPDDRVAVALMSNLENVMPRLFDVARAIADEVEPRP